jgi:hypothetical protein
MSFRVGGAILAATLVLAEGRALADDAACVDASEEALVLRRAGKLRAALKQLAVCGDPSCPREVKEECSRRAEAIEHVIPTLLIRVIDDKANDIIDADVSIDGLPPVRPDGRSITLDPGSHVLHGTAHGITVDRTIVLRESEKNRREDLVIAAPPMHAHVVPTTPEKQGSAGIGAQRIVGISAAALGVIALGVGATFGRLSSSSQSSENRHCASASACAAYLTASNDYSRASDQATFATVGFVAGAVLLAAGAVLFFTGAKASATSPRNVGALFSR